MMKSSSRKTAALAAFVTIAFGSAAVSGELNPRQSTANLEYGDVLKIRLPYGLCEFDQVVPAYVVDQLSERRDWRRLVEYMLTNCPDLGLPLADTATASISEPGSEGSDGGSDGSSGTGTGGDGSDTGGDDGSDTGGGTDTGGDSSTDDDGNNGHGNDADGHDESNPGNG
jgi:uncharacterized membrane protein YgcG